MSLMFDGGSISRTTFILSRFTSIPRLLTIKPKNFQAETPKAHLVGFTFNYSFSGSGMPRLNGLCGARLLSILLACRLYIPP